MGRGIDSYIKEQFGIAEVDIRTYSPLTLAYIGDGIYDLVIRSVVVGKGNTRAGELHKRTSQIVKAHTQAEMMEASAASDRGGSGHLPARQKCQVADDGKECDDVRLPQGHRV